MRGLEVRRLLGQEALNASRSPRYELTQLALANTQQTLVHLRRIDLALDDVEQRDVAVVDASIAVGRDHHVLGLEETTHHVEHGRLAHFRLFFFVG